MKSFKYSLIAILALLAGGAGYAQTNLVPNGGFDEVSGKIRSGGMIELAEPWTSPTDALADIYSGSAKSSDFRAPENMYGREIAESGENYAGLMMYSYREAEERSYLTIQLEKPLVEGKIYCVKFHVSMSDISKYAVNNIGAYLSPKKVQLKNIVNNEIRPQIMHSRNKIFDDQYYWEAICQTYKAAGKEKFLTIGNFAPQDEVKVKKMRRPSGFTKPQTKDGYYYIEDVSVINMAAMGDDECVCEKDLDGGAGMNIVYTQNVSDSLNLDEKGLVELKQVFFNQNEGTLNEDASSTLGEVAKLLKSNPGMKVEIGGHTDPIEQAKDEQGLSAVRAKSAKEWLVKNGIPATQITTKGYMDKEPASDGGASHDLAKNRRVTFKVLSQ